MIESRERDVLCSRCLRARTWNLNAICDRCNVMDHAWAAVDRLRARQEELLAPEPQFDTWEEEWGER